MLPSMAISLPTPTPLRGRAFAALAHRDFRNFWIGQLVSLIGWWMHQTAMVWLVWKLTHSAMLLGVMGFAANVPVLVLGFPAGALVDHIERRRLVLVAQAIEMALAFLTAWLAWSGHVQVWHLIAIAAASGCCTSVEVPARQTLLMDLVGREDLMSAIAMNSAAFSCSRLLGPALGGIALGHITEAGCFVINGLSYLAALLALLAMRPRAPAPSRRGASSMWDGVRYIRTRPEMAALVAMVGAANVFGIPYTQMLPVVVARVLKLGARELGFFQGAVGFGALLAVMLAASRDPRALTPRLAVRGFAAFSITLLAFSSIPGFWTGLALLATLGFCGSTQMATTNNYLQSQAPDGLRGRVAAVYTTTFIGLYPLGCLMMGSLADRIGVQGALATGASACLACALAASRYIPASGPGLDHQQET